MATFFTGMAVLYHPSYVCATSVDASNQLSSRLIDQIIDTDDVAYISHIRTYSLGGHHCRHRGQPYHVTPDSHIV